MTEQIKSPHSDVRVYDKEGKLIRVDSVVEHSMKRSDDKEKNMFRCKTCKHTLNIQLVCEVCNGSQRNVKNQQKDLYEEAFRE